MVMIFLEVEVTQINSNNIFTVTLRHSEDFFKS